MKKNIAFTFVLFLGKLKYNWNNSPNQENGRPQDRNRVPMIFSTAIFVRLLGTSTELNSIRRVK